MWPMRKRLSGMEPTGETRIHRTSEGNFLLEPLSDSLVRVRHGDQTGWIGVNERIPKQDRPGSRRA